MLRMTILDDTSTLNFKLEGKLIGPWVREVEDTWRRTLANQPTRDIRFDLTGLTMVDSAGKALLASARARGAQLVACGCLMRAVVAELTKKAN